VHHRQDPGQLSSKPSDSGAGRIEDSEHLLLETGAVGVNAAVCLRDLTLIQEYIYKELRQFPSELSSEVLNGLTMDELAIKDIQDTEIAMLVKWSLSDPTIVGSEITGVPLPPPKDCERLMRELMELRSPPGFRSIRLDIDKLYYNVPMGTLQYWKDVHGALNLQMMCLTGSIWLNTHCYYMDSVSIRDPYVRLYARLRDLPENSLWGLRSRTSRLSTVFNGNLLSCSWETIGWTIIA
jgi:hypothetical protein